MGIYFVLVFNNNNIEELGTKNIEKFIHLLTTTSNGASSNHQQQQSQRQHQQQQQQQQEQLPQHQTANNK